jgi:hypothetical protein
VRDDDYVLYWMQQAQRAEYNHSLEYAAQASTSTVESLSMYTPITDSLTPIAEVATPKWSPSCESGICALSPLIYTPCLPSTHSKLFS